jgi:hypothetical protein
MCRSSVVGAALSANVDAPTEPGYVGLFGRDRQWFRTPSVQPRTSCCAEQRHHTWPLWVIRVVLVVGYHFRSSPNNGHHPTAPALPKGAISGSRNPHSITSSAKEISPAGIVRLSVLAVLRLITNSNSVACMTGRSAGFSPLRTRPT